jgi:hypothetical protein
MATSEASAICCICNFQDPPPPMQKLCYNGSQNPLAIDFFFLRSSVLFPQAFIECYESAGRDIIKGSAKILVSQIRIRILQYGSKTRRPEIDQNFQFDPMILIPKLPKKFSHQRRTVCNFV